MSELGNHSVPLAESRESPRAIVATSRDATPAIVTSTEALLVRWMVCSGAAALLYEVVLQKLFSYLLGASLLSATVTIASYMVGFSLGAIAFGRSAAQRSSFASALRQYGAIEIGIGVLALAGIVAYGYANSVLADPLGVYLPRAVPARAAVAFAALLPIATLVGGTFPVIARAVFLASASEGVGTPPSLARLYSANLLGAVAGTLLGSYVVMPSVGLVGATVCGFVLNVFVGLGALRAASRSGATAAPVAGEAAQRSSARGVSLELGVLSFASGFLLFAAEILWTHLLSAVVGSSVYAFATMLAAVLLGLYLAARREAGDGDKPSLARVIHDAGVRLALSIPLFALSGFVFGLAGLVASSFFVRELTRFGVALALIVPTTIALSRLFPRLLEHVAETKRSEAVGTLTALNTLGCIGGLFAGRFLLVPVVGSELSLRLLVVVLAGAAAWLAASRSESLRALLGLERTKGRLVLALAVACLVVPSWRPGWLLSSRNIYFKLGAEADYDQMLFKKEDAESGFVTVHRESDGKIELRTNGKFEGNNTAQMQAQLAFAYLPSFIARETKSAFLIGLGTGVTLHGLTEFPFEHIDVAERSMPMVEAARNYFGEVNHGAIDDPRVTLIHDDGRNALLHAPRQYDVISIEITSIWFAGAADLYASEFYRIAKRRLAKGGVLQQWVQLHHMSRDDLWIILHTLRSQFRYVALWYSGSQGQLIGSDEPITVDYARAHRTLESGSGDADGDGRRARVMKMLGGLVLDAQAVDEWMNNVERKAGPFARLLVSSDLWPYLEYATPKNNVLEDTERLNLMYLRDKLQRTTPVVLRNTDAHAADPRFAMTAAYLAQDCAETQRLAKALGETREPFVSCAPWILVPSASRSR